MIYSASSYYAQRHFNDPYFYVKKQGLSFIAGLIIMIMISHIKLDKIKKYSFILLIASYIMLALVFVPGLSIESYGAKRWLNLGLFSFQPSEVSKFCLMIFLAAFMSKKDINKPKYFIIAFSQGLIMSVLIMLEPNMSITMCVLLSTIIMLFIGGAKINYFVMMFLPLAVGIILLIVLEPYRMARLMAFIDPWASPKGEGYQLIQSLYGLGAGGLFGVGLFKSRQKYLFLPFSESDFILSIIGEELGLIGLAVIFLLFLLLILKGIRIAALAEDRFSAFICAGVVIIIAVQSILNIAVVSGSIPPTGLPMPFISSGGSSLVSFMAASGILINVSNRNKLSKI